MEIDFNDKTDFGLKVIKFVDTNRANLIYENKKLYFYDGNRPNFGKRCNAKGREVIEQDVLNKY